MNIIIIITHKDCIDIIINFIGFIKFIIVTNTDYIFIEDIIIKKEFDFLKLLICTITIKVNLFFMLVGIIFIFVEIVFEKKMYTIVIID